MDLTVTPDMTPFGFRFCRATRIGVSGWSILAAGNQFANQEPKHVADSMDLRRDKSQIELRACNGRSGIHAAKHSDPKLRPPLGYAREVNCQQIDKLQGETAIA